MIGDAIVMAGGMFWLVGMAVVNAFREAHKNRYRDRRKAGQCGVCGYDIRGTRDRCPECGTATTRPLHETPLEEEKSIDHDLDVTKLLNDWPITPVDPIPPFPGEATVVLISSVDSSAMEVLAEQLNARGIWASLAANSTNELQGSWVASVTFVRPVVKESEHAQARAILDRFRRNAPVESAAGVVDSDDD